MILKDGNDSSKQFWAAAAAERRSSLWLTVNVTGSD